MQSDLTLIQTMFNRMNGNGFNTNSKLKWGFSFYSDDEKNLQKIYEELNYEGYILEHLEKGVQWHLYVTKVDILSVNKLHKLNTSFDYNGWH